MTKCGNCKKYDDCRSGSGLIWPCGAYVPKIITNADRIRSMTDEKLAEWLDKTLNQYRKDWTPIGCYHCINYGTHHSDKSNIGTKFEYLYECKGCEFENGLLEWLKSESNDAKQSVSSKKGE